MVNEELRRILLALRAGDFRVKKKMRTFEMVVDWLISRA